MLKNISLCLVLLCAMAMPSFAVDCDNPVGPLAAFVCSGPNRPPALEDQAPPFGFLLIFGEEPPPFGPGGRTINLVRDLVPVLEWRRARREFKELSDYDMPVDLAVSITEHTGGIPVVWESLSGKTYLAVVDIEKPLYRVPIKTLELKDAVLTIVHNIVGRGGCVLKVPGGRGTEVLRGHNAENCGVTASMIEPDKTFDIGPSKRMDFVDFDSLTIVPDDAVVEVYRGTELTLVEVPR